MGDTPGYTQVQSQGAKTDRYGNFSISVQIPEDVKTNDVRLSVSTQYFSNSNVKIIGNYSSYPIGSFVNHAVRLNAILMDQKRFEIEVDAINDFVLSQVFIGDEELQNAKYF